MRDEAALVPTLLFVLVAFGFVWGILYVLRRAGQKIGRCVGAWAARRRVERQLARERYRQEAEAARAVRVFNDTQEGDYLCASRQKQLMSFVLGLIVASFGGWIYGHFRFAAGNKSMWADVWRDYDMKPKSPDVCPPEVLDDYLMPGRSSRPANVSMSIKIARIP